MLCPVCAARVGVGSDDELRCHGCGLREPLLRTDAAPRSPITLFDTAQICSYAELRDAARAFGRDESYTKLIFRCDGLNISAGLDIDSAVVRGIDYALGTAGIPDVRFRREDDHDVMAKERGVARELQTGDEAFDRAVYIESDAPDAHLSVMLAAPGVRAAIARLIELGLTVRIQEGTVSTSDDAKPACFAPERLSDIVGLLRVVAGAPRSLEPVVEEPKSGARVVANLVYLFLPVGIVLLWLGSSQYPQVGYSTHVFTGIAAGIVIALLIQPLLTRAVRGRSTSHRELVPLRSASFVGFSVFAIGTVILLNGALDRSAEWVEQGTVESASHDSEDGNTSVTIRTAKRTLETTIEDRRNELRKGNAATVWLRGGAFGQPWKTRPIQVTSK